MGGKDLLDGERNRKPGLLVDRNRSTAGTSGASTQGLTLAEAKQRLARASRLKPHRASAWSLLWDQFKSPIILLLFCSAVLSFTLLDDATNGLIIVFILVVSGLLSFWQELTLPTPWRS